MANKSRSIARAHRHARVRKNLSGSAQRPRLNVYRSLSGIYAQIIDDQAGHTLVSASTVDGDLREKIKPETTSGLQLSFIQLDDPVLEEIRDDLTRLNINTLTPVEALMKLSEIKKRLG